MKSISAALIKAKSNFKPILKTKTNPAFKFKYAPLDAILEAISQALADAGLLLLQPTVIREDKIILQTVLIHAESGEQIESELIIPTQADPQKLGAAMTYYRRFSLCSLLAITADDDDDGNIAKSNANLSRHEIIDRLISSGKTTSVHVKQILVDEFGGAKVSSLSDSVFDKLVSRLSNNALPQ